MECSLSTSRNLAVTTISSVETYTAILNAQRRFLFTQKLLYCIRSQSFLDECIIS